MKASERRVTATSGVVSLGRGCRGLGPGAPRPAGGQALVTDTPGADTEALTVNVFNDLDDRTVCTLSKSAETGRGG